MNGLGSAGSDNPHLRKIYNALEKFRPVINGITAAAGGDSTLRVDKQEVVVSKLNGFSGKV